MRRAGRTLVIATTLGALVAPIGATSAKAGFFESLFGARQAQVPVYVQPAPIFDPADAAREEARRRARDAARQAAARRAREMTVAKAAALQADDPGSLGVFFGDDSLRAGDVVVTKTGLMVFKGSRSGDHDAADFVAVANASNVRNRDQLNALQAAARMALPRQIAEAGSPARGGAKDKVAQAPAPAPLTIRKTARRKTTTRLATVGADNSARISALNAVAQSGASQ